MSSPLLRALGGALVPLIVSGCTPAPRVAPAMARGSVPSALAFHAAMESAFSQDLDGQTVTSLHCRPVRQLECVPIEQVQRSRCTYRYERDRMGTAILELERHGFWRWLSGPKNCSASRISSREFSNSPASASRPA